MNFTPTPEQQAIAEATRTSGASLMISALAGTAKSTTIINMIAPNLPPSQSVIALAFNKKIAQELISALPESFTVKTMNGLGHGAWMRAISGKKITLDDRKIGKIITNLGKQSSLDEESWDHVRQLVTAAMTRGVVPAKYPMKGLLPDDIETWEEISEAIWLPINSHLISIARVALQRSCEMSFQGEICFDDQIYMSTLFNGVYPSFHTVIVDEAQDLSPLNHLQIRKLRPKRVIVCGDPKQAIYAFRGADHNSMSTMRALAPEWIDLTLSTTFRCPRVVVERQLDHAPNYTAAPQAPEGQIVDLTHREWDWDKIQTLANPGETIAVLCRNNGPLLSLCFKLIRRKIGVSMLGRDIGKNLVALSKKIFPDGALPAGACVTAVRQWETTEIELARANGKEGKIEGIQDRVECLIAVIEGSSAENAQGIRESIKEVFAKDGMKVVLGSCHRAKGLEWPVVVHLDPFRIPSKYAASLAARGDPSQLIQENNIRYVAETRTKRTLALANLEDFGDSQ